MGYLLFEVGHDRFDARSVKARRLGFVPNHGSYLVPCLRQQPDGAVPDLPVRSGDEHPHNRDLPVNKLFTALSPSYDSSGHPPYCL